MMDIQLPPRSHSVVATNAPDGLDLEDAAPLGIPFFLPHGMLRVVVVSGDGSAQAARYEESGYVGLVAAHFDELYVAAAVRWGGSGD
jgi:hypothetical protein